MKKIKDYIINESLNREKYFVLKVKNGTYKDNYIYADADWYKTSKNISDAKKENELKDAKEFKESFEQETKGQYGDVDIIQVDITYKVVK
jgi:hypothetical protein